MDGANMGAAIDEINNHMEEFYSTGEKGCISLEAKAAIDRAVAPIVKALVAKTLDPKVAAELEALKQTAADSLAVSEQVTIDAAAAKIEAAALPNILNIPALEAQFKDALGKLTSYHQPKDSSKSKRPEYDKAIEETQAALLDAQEKIKTAKESSQNLDDALAQATKQAGEDQKAYDDAVAKEQAALLVFTPEEQAAAAAEAVLEKAQKAEAAELALSKFVEIFAENHDTLFAAFETDFSLADDATIGRVGTDLQGVVDAIFSVDFA